MILPATAAATGGYCRRCRPPEPPKRNAVEDLHHEALNAAAAETGSLQQASLAICRTKVNTVRLCPLARDGCPGLWDKLESTGDPSVRRCRVCSQNVFLVAGDQETISRVRAGHRIARSGFGAAPLVILYDFGAPPALTMEEQGLLREAWTERARMAALSVMASTTRDCPKCGFPWPDSQSGCAVCAEYSGTIPVNQRRVYG
jgi:hypothetical protein